MKSTPMAQEGQLREVLEGVAERARLSGCGLTISGRSALWLRGLPCHLDAIEVIAEGPPSGHVDAQDLPGGGWTWQEGTVTVRWVQRADRYAPLYRAAAARAVEVAGSPLPVAPISLVAAQLLARRNHEDAALITGMIAAGRLDADLARETVGHWLGIYALDDLDTLIQEAEWQAMRQRYERGEEPH